MGGRVTEKVLKWEEKTADLCYAFAQSIFIGSRCPLGNKTQTPSTPCPVLSPPLISEPVPIHLLGTHLRTFLIGM